MRTSPGSSASIRKRWHTLSSFIWDPIEDEKSRSAVPAFAFEDRQGSIFLGVHSIVERQLAILELNVPDIAESFFPDVSYLGVGWSQSVSMGMLCAHHFPWIWSHGQQVWQYVAVNGNSDSIRVWEANQS